MRDTNEMRDKLIHEFVEKYMEKLFYFCLRKTDSRAEAEDLTQDIALNIITALEKGTVPTAFSAWVWRIAHNRYSAWADDKHRRAASVTGSDVYDCEIIDDNPGTLDEMIHNEQMALLRRELAFIKSIYRDIVVAYYIDDRSIRDIAASMSLSESAVEQRLFRARKILKEGMDMAREFGKMSYRPENLRFQINGLPGSNGEPSCYLSKALDKNILLAAYRTPSTAEELAIEIGVALPYMEEELDSLVSATLLIKRNNRYETNFYIFSASAQEKIYSRYREIAPLLTEKLIEICKTKNDWLDKISPDWRFGNQPKEDMRWADIMSTLDDINKRAVSEANKSIKCDCTANIGSWGHTIRPNNGEWDVIGFEDCKDAPDGISLRGCVDSPDDRNLKEILFRHYTFLVLGQQYYNQTLSYREGENLLKIAEGKTEETEKSVVDSLVKKGFLLQTDGKPVPTFCVIRKEKADSLPEDVLMRIRELKDAAIRQIIPLYRFAIECISAEAPSFISNKEYLVRAAASGILWERDIIAKAAMKNGYLKIPQEESRIKMLGATLTI